MTLDEYLAECWEQWRQHPEWRMGQTMFNVLKEVRPGLAYNVLATNLDPFYRDEATDKFLEYLNLAWEVSNEQRRSQASA